MTSSATYLLHSRVPVSSEFALRVATPLAGRDRGGVRGHATFIALDEDEVMELTAFDSIGDLPAVLAERAELERAVMPWLAGEWRHEILVHVEDVVSGTGSITDAPMVEMRHIEVPPPLYAEYRVWRERTIYGAVRGRPEIESFCSYQSIVSTTPGVMFVVGFSGDPNPYWEIYRTPEYLAILEEAGSRFIAQGPSGLQCKTYGRPEIIMARRERAA